MGLDRITSLFLSRQSNIHLVVLASRLKVCEHIRNMQRGVYSHAELFGYLLHRVCPRPRNEELSWPVLHRLQWYYDRYSSHLASMEYIQGMQAIEKKEEV